MVENALKSIDMIDGRAGETIITTAEKPMEQGSLLDRTFRYFSG